MNYYRTNLQNLQNLLKTHNIALALLAGTDQMRYLTGWREGGHERFVGLFIPKTGEPIFVVPKMNAPQAAKTPAQIQQVFGWTDENGWQPCVQNLLQELHLKPNDQILVDDELHSVHLLGLQTIAPQLKFVAAGQTMATLRELKTDAELASLQTAANLIDEIYLETLGELKEGITEQEIQDFVLSAIKKRGSAPSFSPLICFGANTALPHHHTGTTKLKHGDIVILDIGCLSDYYASDITRTVPFGKPSDPEAEKVYQIINEAHWSARNSAKPGMAGEQVDNASRKVITDAGYGEFFVHRTGHGIGLSTHEPPYIVQGNNAPLKIGMCFSVEPGIYLPERFGIRIENIVTVTPNGVRSLNADAPHKLKTV